MYADKEIKAPGRCIKHVRAGSCTSIKADKCFVQLMGSQIATLGDRESGQAQGWRPERPGQDGDRAGHSGECGAQAPAPRHTPMFHADN